jgi:hypothetical protein
VNLVGWIFCVGGSTTESAHVSLWLQPPEETRILKNLEKLLS